MTDPCLEAQKDVQFRHFAAVGAWMNGVAQSFPRVKKRQNQQ
jgi:hypothetical protein